MKNSNLSKVQKLSEAFKILTLDETNNLVGGNSEEEGDELEPVIVSDENEEDDDFNDFDDEGDEIETNFDPDDMTPDEWEDFINNIEYENDDNNDSPNIIELPIEQFKKFFKEVATLSAEAVYKKIGGNVYKNYLANPTAFANACALRISYALNMLGANYEIAYQKDHTISSDIDGDGQKEWFYYRVTDIIKYLDNTFGDFSKINSLDSISGEEGFLLYDDCNWSDASGHVDFWDGSSVLSHDEAGECSTIYFMVLN